MANRAAVTVTHAVSMLPLEPSGSKGGGSQAPQIREDFDGFSVYVVAEAHQQALFTVNKVACKG